VAEVRRKRGESFESLIRRFHKKLQQNGKLIRSRKVQFYERPKSRNLLRESALRRLKIKSEKEYLKKIGKLKEDDFKGRKRR
jgi:ribosomal protein S21